MLQAQFERELHLWQTRHEFAEKSSKIVPLGAPVFPSISDSRARFFQVHRSVVDDRSGPEANTEDKSERNIKKRHAASQSGGVPDTANNHWHYRAAYDSRSQNA
jgi:hypothetical protein